MALTVRLSPKTERALNNIVKRRKMSRSDVVREAIARYEEVEANRTGTTPYGAWLDVVGIVNLGARDRGRTTGEQFAAILRQSRKPRHAR